MNSQPGKDAANLDKLMLQNRIKSARVALGLSQEEAAKALDIGQSYLSKIERGDKRPNVELLSQMARLYGVTESHLLGRPGAGTEDLPTTQEGVITDDATPPGLRALAADRSMVEALEIDADEWRVLRSIDLPSVSKGGYVQLLSTIRGVREQSARYVGRPASVLGQNQDADEAGS
jgi:transcriptional regulator with XRE-family HTH domain